MANVIQGPNTFTVDEWHASNSAKLNRAEFQRNNAKNLIEQTRQIIVERQDQTEKGQRDVEQRLGQRIDSVKFWHSELSRQLSALNSETGQLDAYKRRLEAAVAGCKQPLDAAEQCLHNRSNRINIDLVHDNVQKQLLTEVQVVNGVSAMLSRALEQVVEQIRCNRSSAYHLSADLKDKDQTLTIDNEALSQSNLSVQAVNHIERRLSELTLARQQSNVPKINSTWTTPGDWQAYSENGIAKAEEELQHSLRLRSAVDEIITCGTEDLRKQKTATDNALRQRLEDVNLAKTNLENERSEILEQINQICGQISATEEAIKAKNAPKSVAEERTRSRATNRPAPVELCRDAVQYRLMDELEDIHSSVLELNEKLHQLKFQLNALNRAELDVSEDISVKSQSLDIDNACVAVRVFDIKSY